MHSASQLLVLSLYRRVLRVVSVKSPSSLSSIRSEFRLNSSSIPRSNTSAIEYEIRKLKKQLELYESTHVKQFTIHHLK